MSADEELKRELRELVTLVGNLSKNHADVLKRHEENFFAAHKAAASHAEAITDLRADMKRLENGINVLQECVVQLQKAVAIDDPMKTPPASSALN
jgi:hypothetical protein